MPPYFFIKNTLKRMAALLYLIIAGMLSTLISFFECDLQLAVAKIKDLLSFNLHRR